jgi:two-component system, sensor histidine kinase PdtaS
MIYPTDADYEFVGREKYAQIAKKGTGSVETRFRHKDGTVIDVLLSSTPIDAANSTRGVTFTALDITERRQAEEALRTSEAQLSNALSMAHAGHWEYDVASDTFTFNDNFYQIFRTTAKEVGGYKMSSAEYARKFCHPDDTYMVRQETQAAIETADPTYSRQLEHRIFYANGEVGYIAVRFFIVKNSQGRTVKTYGVNQDITERKKAEMELLREKQFTEKLLESLPGIFFLYDSTCHLKRWNKAHETAMGFTADELRDWYIPDWHETPEDAAIGMALVKSVLDTGVGGAFESTLINKEGRFVPYLLSVTRLMTPDGPVMMGVGIDITERKRVQEELARHRDRLEELVKERTAELEKEIVERKAALAEKEILLREVHHRVKNNLNTIANILYFQTKTIQDQKALAAFQDSQNRIHSMARVHEHLYRSESLAQVNMAAYFEDLAADMQQTGGSGSVSIRIDATKEHLDIDQAIPCGLIVNELVTNALKYAFRDGSTNQPHEVAVRLTTQADQHILEVRDNGTGLPSGLDVEKSTSLGLRLVSMLTRQLKGRLTVDTAAEKGTRFAIAFPLETKGAS